jgi:hypothetical protein
MKVRWMVWTAAVFVCLTAGCERTEPVDAEADPQGADAEQRPWQDWQAPEVRQPDLTAAEAFRAADEEFSAALQDLSANGYADPTRADDWPTDDPEAMTVIARRLKPAYEAIEAALAKEPRVRRMQSILGDAPMLWHHRLREYGYAFGFRSKWRQQQGRYADAASDGVNCVRLGTVLMSGASSISVPSGLGMDWYGVRVFRDVAPHLSAETGRETVGGIAGAIEGRPTFEEIIQHEMIIQLRGLRTVLKDLSSEEIAAAWEELEIEPEDIDRAEVWNQTLESWQKVAAEAKKPYWEREAIDPPENVLAQQYTLTAPLDSASGSVFSSLGFKLTHGQAALRLEMMRLATWAYRQEQGAMPDEASDLAPEYIDGIPDDPFGPGPLRAQVEEPRVTYYSVGPDGADDGGVPARVKRDRQQAEGDIGITVE